MITNNLKQVLAAALQSNSTVYGSMRVRGVNNVTYYAHCAYGAFPSTRAETFTLTASAAGVSFGKGSTPPTEEDTNLENTITSGITVTLTSRLPRCDSYGNPYLEYTFTITNTGSETLLIREVGYKQTIKCSTTPGRNNSVDVVCLLDRTLLDVPLEIAAGDAGVLVYTLKTLPHPAKTVNGVEIVGFDWGTDEQIAAVLDAAKAGTIDLQEDAGWRVGDMRRISIGAFTGGGGSSHAAQNVDIVISSFDDYNECGCIMQFDFVEALATGQRMNASNTTAGGYGSSEMCTTTLPALVEALPEWLKTRLATFNVVANGGSSNVVTVADQKLALRSTMEIFGSKQHSQIEEGTQIQLYKLGYYRPKLRGYSGSTNLWWERSVYSGSHFCLVYSDGSSSIANASDAYGIAPFGCI